MYVKQNDEYWSRRKGEKKDLDVNLFRSEGKGREGKGISEHYLTVAKIIK